MNLAKCLILGSNISYIGAQALGLMIKIHLLLEDLERLTDWQPHVDGHVSAVKPALRTSQLHRCSVG